MPSMVSMPSMVRFRVLGPLEVAHGRRVLELKPLKEQAVLAILLVHAGRLVSVDRLVDELWGGRPPNSAVASLHVYVSNLRAVLEPGRAARAAARVLVTRPPGYLLVVEPGQVDAAGFEAALGRGRAELAAGQVAEARLTFASALDCWRGEQPYAGLHGYASAAAEAARLRELRQSALEARIEADLALGRHHQVAPELDRLVAEHPLREELRALQMLALYRAGRQADALASFHQARQALAEQFGVDPGALLQHRFADILEHSPTLDWHPPAQALAQATSPSRPGRPLGRAAELARLQAALAGALAGRGRLMLLAGEAGIGKTRLAEALAECASEAGATVAWGRSVEGGDAPALWPWAQVLRQLAAAQPERFAAVAGPLAGPLGPLAVELAGEAVPAPTEPAAEPGAAQFLLYDAVERILGGLAAAVPLLVVLESLHWADLPSLQLLKFLAGELREGRLLLVATLRTGEAPASRSLGDLLEALARAPAAERLDLGPLDREAVGELVTAVSGHAPAAELVASLHARSDGNPFFVIELARLLRDDGPAAVAAIPASVRDVVRRRVACLPAATRAVLRVAAVVGRDFDLAVLEPTATVATEELLDCLDDAVAAGLLIENGARIGRWRFVHALVREALYQDLNQVRRAHLHAAVAAALLALADAGGRTDEVAHHLRHAQTVRGCPPPQRHDAEGLGHPQRPNGGPSVQAAL